MPEGNAVRGEGVRSVRPDPDVVVRPLRSHDDYRACVQLQKATWGEGFTEGVPPSILMVGQKIGGVSAGAFDAHGRLLGFVFGLTGVMDGRLVHWSDMLAVREEAQGLGIGIKLKAYQRERLLELGIEVAYWTFDPLVARNAHLNVNRLGADIADYVPDMYGPDTGSDLHRGLGTDRFLVVWRLRDERVARALSGEVTVEAARFADAPIANAHHGEEGELPDADMVRVEIPSDIHAVRAADPARAAEWRATTRRAFLESLKRGYRVRAFYRDARTGRCFYGLLRDPRR